MTGMEILIAIIAVLLVVVVGYYFMYQTKYEGLYNAKCIHPGLQYNVVPKGGFKYDVYNAGNPPGIPADLKDLLIIDDDPIGMLLKHTIYRNSDHGHYLADPPTGVDESGALTIMNTVPCTWTRAGPSTHKPVLA
jgi:hypothetical protein